MAWLVQVPDNYPKNGDIFGHKIINGLVHVQKQWWWNFLKYKGFTTLPIDFGRSYTKPEKNERVLHSHHGGVGDVLFISSVGRVYKETYPKIEQHIATSSYAGDLFENSKDFDRFILDEQHCIGNYIDQYDDAITYDAAIAGNGDSTIKNIYDIYFDWAGLPLPIIRGEVRVKPVIYLTDEEKVVGGRLLKEFYGVDPTDKIVVLQYESSTAIRNIEKETFIILAKRLVADGYKVFLFGNAPVKDFVFSTCPHCGKHRLTIMNDEVLSVTRACSECKKPYTIDNSNRGFKDVYSLSGIRLRDIAYVISVATMFIGVDSCGLHIAAAFDIPSLGLFSSFDGDLRLRYYKNARWLQKPYRCAPCFLHHIPCRHAEGIEQVPPCMRQFTVDEIYDEFKKMEKGEKFTKPSIFIPKEPRSCPVCTSNFREFITRKGSICYYECKTCSACYCDEVNVQEGYDEETYFCSIYTDKAYIDGQNYFARVINDKFSKIFNYSGSLLDVGCGMGSVVSELRRLGWNALGLEGSKGAKEKVLKLFPEFCDFIIWEDFLKYKELKQYNILFFNNSFEHFVDPVATIKHAERFLTPDGYITMIVPNSDKWVKINNKWGHINAYTPGEHSVLYNFKCISILADRMGYVITESSFLEQAECIWVTMKKKEQPHE